MAALRKLRFTPLAALVRRRLGGAGPGALAGIPILLSSDLDRTAAFYLASGFTETERCEGYLLLHNGPVELHFSLADNAVPGRASSTSVTR